MGKEEIMSEKAERCGWCGEADHNWKTGYCQAYNEGRIPVIERLWRVNADLLAALEELDRAAETSCPEGTREERAVARAAIKRAEAG